MAHVSSHGLARLRQANEAIVWFLRHTGIYTIPCLDALLTCIGSSGLYDSPNPWGDVVWFDCEAQPLDPPRNLSSDSYTVSANLASLSFFLYSTVNAATFHRMTGRPSLFFSNISSLKEQRKRRYD